MKPFENAAAVAAPQDGNHVLPVNQSCFQAQPVATPTGFKGNAVSLSALLNCDQEVPLQPITNNSTALDAQLAERKAEVQRMAAQVAAQPVFPALDGSLDGVIQVLAQALSKVEHPEYKCLDCPRITKLVVAAVSMFAANHASPEAAGVLAADIVQKLPLIGNGFQNEQWVLLAAADARNTAGLYQIDIVPTENLVAQLQNVLDQPIRKELLEASANPEIIKSLNARGEACWPVLEQKIKAQKSGKRAEQAKADLDVILKELEDKKPQQQFQRVFSDEVLGLMANLNHNDALVTMGLFIGLCPTVKKRELNTALEKVRGERNALRIESKPRDRKLIKLPMNDRDLLAASLEGLAEYQREKKEAFVMSGKLARIIRDEGGKPRIELLLKKDQASHLLSESIDYFKKGNRGGYAEWTPSDKLVGDVMSIGEYPLPRLKGITQIPILRNDGTVVTTPGYDGETGLYYAPPPNFDLPGIPDEPTEEDVAQAVQFIEGELFTDFPFVSDADKANAWAELLTLFLREFIDGSVPAILHDAPSPGTGKTLLARVTSTVVTGNDAGLLPKPENEAEMKKVLTAELISGSRLIVFDNFVGKLDSPTLCGVITTGLHKDRILGKSDSVTVPMNALPIITMNNCEVGGDMGRRVVLIRMDAKKAEPWKRESGKFHHDNLLGWIEENRGAVLGQLLTIASAWLKAGSPAPTNPPKRGGFEDWIRVIGGVLEFAKISGFLDNSDFVAEMVDGDTPQIEGFLLELYSCLRRSPLTSNEMKAADWKVFIDRGGDHLKHLLPDELADAFESNQPGLSRSIGKWFHRNNDRRFGEYGLRIENAGKRQNAIVWRLAWDNEPQAEGLWIQSDDGTAHRLGPAPQIEQEVK